MSDGLWRTHYFYVKLFRAVLGKPISTHSAKNPFSIPIFEGSGTEERSTNYY